MFRELKTENILFLDIETASSYPSYEKLPERFKKLWDRKSEFLKKEENEGPGDIYPRAGIYAEFGKVICISTGFFRGDEFRVKSFYGDDELALLGGFCKLLDHHYSSGEKYLCAHNGKEFDFPYLARRILINGIRLPDILDVAGKKPWEVKFLDTLELWKFGDYKHYTSLELLSAVFDLPTPKDDISGSDIYKVYWQEHNMERIRSYCQKDVTAVAGLFLKYQQLPGIDENKVVIVE